MTFLHCNLDGSLSRRVTTYSEVNFNLVLDRSDLPDSLKLNSSNRCFSSWLDTQVLRLSIFKAYIVLSVVRLFNNKICFRSYKDKRWTNCSFGSYRFTKNSIAWHVLSPRSLSSKLEFVYPPWPWGVDEQMLIFSSSLTPGWVKGSWNPIPEWTIVLTWKTPACLKLSKMPNRADCGKFVMKKTLSSLRGDRSACFFGNDRSSHSRVRTRLITINYETVYYEWARGTLAHTHELKSVLARYQAALMLQQVTFAKFCFPAKSISMWQERIIFQRRILCRPQHKGQPIKR